jgi:hypothetical protein
LEYQTYRKFDRLHMQKLYRLIIAICFTFTLVSCSINANRETYSSENNSATQIAKLPVISSTKNDVTATPFQAESKPESIYYSPSVPQDWIKDVGNLKVTQNAENADLILDIAGSAGTHPILAQFQRIYAIGVPFDTVTDGMTLAELQALWSAGTPTVSGYSKIFLSDATARLLTVVWGKPYESVINQIDTGELASELWKTSDGLAIIPFEQVEPRFKVLKVDGISPIDRPMDVEKYGLTFTYTLTGKDSVGAIALSDLDQIKASIPATNRDESKMTVVMMTGTTALARVTLKKIELNGYDYPVDMVRNWFLNADLRHVSNEVSFMEGCEYTDAFTMQFCSKPDQIKVLENIGVNVVESTGNHLNDYPGDAFTKTLKMYQDRGWLNFGGGINEEAALQPATTEVNGNKIAFIGCNPVGFSTDWATETRAGSANCDYVWMDQKITELKSQGYVVITTFQAWEIDKQMYDEYYRKIFKDAANAGADIVQGSQAHVPMGFEFVNNSFIHYGLGNFLFDQMEPHNIREFYDRHIIYNGKYISTELLTATLTDWSRPVPMNERERRLFLEELFTASRMR